MPNRFKFSFSGCMPNKWVKDKTYLILGRKRTDREMYINKSEQNHDLN